MLFGSETWVVTPRMGRVLGGFQDQVARRLTGRLPRQKTDGKWEYTLAAAAAARDEAGFQTMQEYIWRRQKTVAQYITTRSMLDLCEGLEKALEARVGMRWWDQAGIDLAGALEAAAAVAESEEDGVEE